MSIRPRLVGDRSADDQTPRSPRTMTNPGYDLCRKTQIDRGIKGFFVAQPGPPPSMARYRRENRLSSIPGCALGHAAVVTWQRARRRNLLPVPDGHRAREIITDQTWGSVQTADARQHIVVGRMTPY